MYSPVEGIQPAPDLGTARIVTRQYFRAMQWSSQRPSPVRGHTPCRGRQFIPISVSADWYEYGLLADVPRWPGYDDRHSLAKTELSYVSASAASIASRPAGSPTACTGWIATCAAPGAKCPPGPDFPCSAAPHSTIASMNASDPPLARSASVKPMPSQA